MLHDCVAQDLNWTSRDWHVCSALLRVIGGATPTVCTHLRWFDLAVLPLFMIQWQ
jgi:hypothetical protein